MNSSKEIYVSIVVPVFNEAANLEALVSRIVAAMRPMGRPFELIIVDDGSTDESRVLLTKMTKSIPELIAIMLRRNFGQSAAMTAGFEHARGEIVVSMDGDLQNDPKDIARLVEVIEEGYDLVSGWRKDRKDPFISRRFPSIIANYLIGMATGVKLHDYGCSLKAYRSEVAKNLLLYGELHRFIPVLANFYGVRIAEEVVHHHPRTHGKSKYGIGRTYRVILDLLLMLFFQRFATRPLQFFGGWGGGMFAGGVAIGFYLTCLKLFNHQDIGGRPLLMLSAVLIISGLIFISIGLLAELMVRTYYESTGRRIYSIREVVGGGAPSSLS
ncbi:MAG: glycosyltransferase family 2 protein [Deltaproteobacteria bacterium]|nr:glycosyltransferase family 2 protein [Deltaproteobacteria bacterium]